MKRIGLSLDAKDYRLLKKSAKRQSISMAEYVRRAVRQSLSSNVDSEKPWMKYAGMVKSGDPNSSLRIDDVVYGPRKRLFR